MSVQTQITRIENAKTAIKTAIEGKGVTVQPDTKIDGMAALIDSIKAGGGGEVLNFFGGSKYYVTEVTPSSTVDNITITPDDISILDSPKFLLVTQDIPTTRNAVQTRTIAIMPSTEDISAIIAFSIGQVYLYCAASISPYSGTGYGYGYTSKDGSYAFNGSNGITISGGTMTIRAMQADIFFKSGQTYKVLLIG